MKRLSAILMAVLFSSIIWAQAPEKMSYQAVIRDANNDLVKDRLVGMRISILQGSTTGTVVYVETQAPTSNANGLVSIEIGSGETNDAFTGIDWSNGPYFIKTDTDPTGGTNYTITGTSQLLSVPFALHAKTAESSKESDPEFSNSVAGAITAADTSSWNSRLKLEVDGSVTNEIQSISKTGSTVTLSRNGGSFQDSVNTQDLADVLSISNVANAQIKGIIDPTEEQDAATKAYVDALKSMIAGYENRLSELEFETGLKAKDRDGNMYSTVKIGNQVWMAENLKTTKLRDGTDIPLVEFNSQWEQMSTPAYCYYQNAGPGSINNYGEIYGALYNWYTVETGLLCPSGWHVPSQSEWTTLIDYLGGEDVAGGKMKETGTTHWNNPNKGATNESGFTALPGGGRVGDGRYGIYVLGVHADWWSSTLYDNGHMAFVWEVSHIFSSAGSWYDFLNMGFSVRCLKD